MLFQFRTLRYTINQDDGRKPVSCTPNRPITLARRPLPAQAAKHAQATPQGERRIVMQYVFVVDSEGQPLMPCRPARARKLLTAGRAAVYRRYPFTILLKEPVVGEGQPTQVK